jgi:hypothetical protein
MMKKLPRVDVIEKLAEELTSNDAENVQGGANIPNFPIPAPMYGLPRPPWPFPKPWPKPL